MKKDEIITKCKDCGTGIIVHKSRANQPTLCIYCKTKASREESTKEESTKEESTKEESTKEESTKKDEVITKCKDCGTGIIVHKSRAHQPAQCIYCKTKDRHCQGQLFTGHDPNILKKSLDKTGAMA